MATCGSQVTAGASVIGQITTAGVITTFAVPPPGQGSNGGIVTGPDGNLWYTEGVGNKIARVALGGAPVPPAFTDGPPPNGTMGTAYNFTYTASGTTPITFAVTTGALPTGLALSSAGVISGTPTATGTSCERGVGELGANVTAA